MQGPIISSRGFMLPINSQLPQTSLPAQPLSQICRQVTRRSISVTIRTNIPGQEEEFRTHHFSPEFVDFVVKCTQPLPQERTEATALLSHAFFQRYLSTEQDFQASLNEEALL